MDLFSIVLLFAGMVLGLAIIPFGLPGMFLIIGSILIYAILTDFSAGVGVGLFVVLCILTVVGETADNILTAIGARRFGATRGSMWLSFAGGLLGAILIGGPLAFIFGPLGPVAGGFAGAFLIVVLYELYRGKNRQEALRAGWGTFLGRTAGILLKLVIAIAMIIAVAAAILF